MNLRCTRKRNRPRAPVHTSGSDREQRHNHKAVQPASAIGRRQDRSNRVGVGCEARAMTHMMIGGPRSGSQTFVSLAGEANARTGMADQPPQSAPCACGPPMPHALQPNNSTTTTYLDPEVARNNAWAQHDPMGRDPRRNNACDVQARHVQTKPVTPLRLHDICTTILLSPVPPLLLPTCIPPFVYLPSGLPCS